MTKVYKNQDYLRIVAHIGQTLSDAQSVVIKYKDPNGVEGSWSATVSDVLNGIVYKDFAAGNTLGVSGKWTFWAHVTFNDSRTAPGEPYSQMIYDEGS
jgi:hypothetical protein